MPPVVLPPNSYLLGLITDMQAQINWLRTQQVTVLRDNTGYPRTQFGPLTADPDYTPLDPNVWGFGVVDRSNPTSDYVAKMTEDGFTGPIMDRGGEVFDVRAYGAVGDGTTDDTAAIEATMAAAGTGTVFFGGRGNVYMCNAIVLETAGQSYEVGPGVTLKLNQALSTNAAFLSVTAADVTLYSRAGGTIDGNWGIQSSADVIAIEFQVGADDGTVQGLTIQNTGDCVRTAANRTRILNNKALNWYWNGFYFLTGSAPVSRGWCMGNRISMPDVNVPPSGSLSAINIQNNDFFNCQATQSAGGSATVTLAGYTVATDGREVGWQIEIAGAGLDASGNYKSNLYATITAASHSANTVTVDVPGWFLPNFTGGAGSLQARLIGNPIDGIIAAHNVIDYTATDGGIAFQLFVAQNCVIAHNEVNAFPGVWAGGTKGSSFGVSMAGGSGHRVIGNVLKMNGNAAGIECDSSLSVIAHNYIEQYGNGQGIHGTGSHGWCQDVVIDGNTILMLYGENSPTTNYCISFETSSVSSGKGLKIVNNHLHLWQCMGTDNAASACIWLGGPNYYIAGNDLDCGNSQGILLAQAGSQMGRIVGNNFSGGCLSMVRLSGALTAQLEDLLIQGNQATSDCVTTATYTLPLPAGGTATVNAGIPMDATVAEGAANALAASVANPNVVYKDNYQSGVGKPAAFRYSFASSPKTLTNISTQRWLVFVQGDATAGPVDFTGFIYNGQDFTATGSSDSNGWSLAGTGAHPGAGPFCLPMDPGDTLELAWTGSSNPIVFVFPQT